MKDDTVSSTAFNVAQGVLYISQNEKLESLVSEPEKVFYKKILTSSQEGLKKWKQLQSPLFRFFVPVIERLMVPGLIIHYVLRKKAIENFTRSAVKYGARQIVNMGAGFDSLVYRIAAENPEICGIELDHPATHRVKKEALNTPENIGQIPENFHMLEIDFNKDTLESKLGQCKYFDPNLPTVFIIEGVLMYLEESKIRALFDSIKKMSNRGFRLIFTFITPDGDGKYTRGPLLNLYLKFKSEALNWKISSPDLRLFMNDNRIPLQEVVRSPDTLLQLMPDSGGHVVHDGELIACADYTH